MDDEDSNKDPLTDEKMSKKMVHRQAARLKSLPKPLLESVSETGDDNVPKGPKDGLVPGQTQAAEEDEDLSGGTGADCFGVKSYLHHFYEVMSVKNPHLYEDLEGGVGEGGGRGGSLGMGEDDDLRYLFRSKKRRCRAFWWKVALWGSANLLAIGAIVILVGYLVPRRQVVIGQQRDLEIIDRGALKFNRNLDACKVVGLVVFCVGGAALAAALLLPSFVCNYCDEEAAAAFVVVRPSPASVARYTKRQRDSRASKRATSTSSSSSASASAYASVEAETEAKSKVPVTEQVTGVQPKWNDAECIATKQGLCSLP